MSADDQNIDLELALGGNSGAGVNAGSSVNLKFPASDSLSELVWSPQRGLRLKCAQGILPDKKAFLLWNMDPSPPESISCKENDDDEDDDKIVEGNLVNHSDERHLEIEVAPTEPTRIVNSIPGLNLESKDELEGGIIAAGVSPSSKTQNEAEKFLEQDYLPENSLPVRNLSLRVDPDSSCGLAKAESPSISPNKDIPIDLNPTSDNDDISNRLPEGGTAAAEGYTNNQSKAHITPLQTIPNTYEEQRKSKCIPYVDVIPCEGKLEYTAENYLACTNDKDAYEQNERIVVRGCSLPLDPGAENRSSNFYCLKGKSKALSEGNFSRRILVNEDVSQESVESCNSAGLLGKKRLDFSEQFMVESKRMKKGMEGNFASTSRHGSSFMNWISNVVSGCSNPNHEDRPSLELTLTHSSHEDRSTFQDNTVNSGLQEPKNANMGFQTLFQSLYCPRTKLLKAGTSENDSSTRGPYALLQVDNTDCQFSPKRFPEQSGACCNPNDISNGKILPSTIENIVDQSDKALVLYRNAPIWNDLKTDSAEIKPSKDQECCKHVNGTSASVSLADHKISIPNEGNSQLACDGRATDSKRKLLGNLWITRFITKESSTPLILDNSTKEDCPADGCAPQNLQTQISQDFSIMEKCPDIRSLSHEKLAGIGKEVQTLADDAESSLDSKKMHENNCGNVVVKLNSAQVSHNSRISEAMASTFARRFNALKHFTPAAEETTSSQLHTSFSCGKSGCNVQSCFKATETERVEVAIAGSNQKSCFVEQEEHLKAPAHGREQTFIDASNQFVMKEFSGVRSFCSNETHNQIKSSLRDLRENKTINPQNLPFIDLVSIDSADIPKGVFDAVRRLRLSRSDMLKWISSNLSLSHLEGLFLRLRLGKSEAGFGGTGYYVAHIAVEESGESSKDCKKSISVKFGGMKCLVECQNISNRDFLEEELMVWWCRILKSGGKVPSKEDLDSRLKRRITLGF